MQGRKWKCSTKFFEGAATSVSAHVAAWTAIASIAFAWRFMGHVAADIAAIFTGY
jgi:hypothetical protein